jgi:hypothetical protein
MNGGYCGFSVLFLQINKKLICAPNIVANICKNGEINTISTSQPIKLAFGLKRIIGMPKLVKSPSGFCNLGTILPPQINAIMTNVTEEVIIA